MVNTRPTSTAVLATEWTLIGVATIIIAARLNLRLRVQRRNILISDVLMCAAWACSVSNAATDVWLADLGALDPYLSLSVANYRGSERDLVIVLKLFWTSSFPFITALYLCKGALLATYLQVFPAFMQKRRMFLWAVIVYVAIAYVTSLLFTTLVCLPPKRNWSLDPADMCDLDLGEIQFIVAWSLHFTGEVLVFILPWLVVTELKMRKRLKVGVYCTFLLGTVNLSFCLARFIPLETGKSPEYYSISFISLWSALDCNIGLIIACLPSLRPYLKFRGGMHYLSNPDEQLKSTSGSHSQARTVHEMSSMPQHAMLQHRNWPDRSDTAPNDRQSSIGQFSIGETWSEITYRDPAGQV